MLQALTDTGSQAKQLSLKLPQLLRIHGSSLLKTKTMGKKGAPLIYTLTSLQRRCTKSNASHFYAYGSQQRPRGHNTASNKSACLSSDYSLRHIFKESTRCCMFISHLTARCSGHNIISYLPNVDAVWHEGSKLWNSIQYQCSCWDAAVSLPWAAVKAVPTHLLRQQQSAIATKASLFCRTKCKLFTEIICMYGQHAAIAETGGLLPPKLHGQTELEVA